MNKTGFGFLRLPEKGGNYDWKEISKLVDRYINLGGRFFDTCYTYLNGNSEKGIKECLTSRYPRDSYILSDKLPGYLCKSYADNQKYFDEMLFRCGVDHFDILMLHWLNKKNYETAEKCDQFRFLREKKAEGKCQLIGFSYHDSASLLDEILTKHPETDIVLIQINYLDWESSGIESKKCYDVCVKHGKKVMVMEPVKGGTLAVLPEEAERLLKDKNSSDSPSKWALRFVQSLSEVSVCLSGMNSIEQIEDNLSDMQPITDEEKELLNQVKNIIEANTAVACTGCRYCIVHCPKKISIPDIFKLYNEICRYPMEDWKIKPVYSHLVQFSGKSSDCISCKSCEKHCPQHLNISETMKNAAQKLE